MEKPPLERIKMKALRFLTADRSPPGATLFDRRLQLAQLVGQLVDPAKFFVGFAGWGEGQLEMELKDGLWMTTPASLEEIFTYGDELWPRLVRRIYGERTISMLKIKHRPDDPSSN
jgi:putative transcriptional regulator